MKKIFLATVCMLFTFIVLAGCFPNIGGEDETPDDTYEAKISFTEEEYNMTQTLKVGITDDPRQSDYIKALATGFKQIFPNVTVEAQRISGQDYGGAVLKLYSADKVSPGTMPDLIMSNSSDCFAFIQKRIFLNLEPYLRLEKARRPNFTDAFHENIWKLGQKGYDGDQYLIPRSADRVVAHFNKTLMKEAGVDFNPDTTVVKNGWTWTQFLDTMQIVRDYYNSQSSKKDLFLVDSWINWEAVMFPIFESMGVQFFNDQKQITVDSEETRNTLDLMYELIDRRFVAPLNHSTQANFEGAQGVMAFHSAPAKHYRDFLEANGYDYDLVTFPLIGDNAKIGCGAAGYSVYSKTPKRDLAWQFLKYMLSADGQNVLAEGGLSSPSIRVDMSDPTTNAWGESFEKENMKAYTWEPERSFAADFYLMFKPENQSKLLNAVSTMVSQRLSKPGGLTSQQAIDACVTDLKNAIR